MELRELEAFVTVAQQRNFTRAADKLSLTQPAVTRQVASLERELGTRLLDRMGRTVEVTEAGRALMEYATDILRKVDESKQAVSEISHGSHGRLSIGASSTAATYILPGLLYEFSEKHPNVQVSLQTGPSGRVAELIAGNSVDLGVVMDRISAPQLANVELGKYKLAAVVYQGHSLARSPGGTVLAVHPRELSDVPLIVMQSGATLRRHVEQIFRESDARLSVLMETDNVETIKKMVQARVGVSIVPQIALEGAASGLVVRPLTGVPSILQPISAVHRTNKYVTTAMKQFLSLLQTRLAETRG